MSEKSLQDQLKLLERQIGETEKQISRQQKVVQEFEIKGLDSTVPKGLLKSLEGTRDYFIAERERLLGGVSPGRG